MVPADVALYNLAAAGVRHVRAIGVLYLSRQIAQHTVAGVVDAHVGVIGPRLGLDGVLEAGSLERHVPVFYSLNQVGHPLLRGGGVYVVHDGLYRLHELSRAVGLDIAGHQAVPGDKGLGLCLVLSIREACKAAREVAHTLVPDALAHGLARQHHYRGVHAKRYGTRGPCGGAAGRRAIGAGGGHLYVDGKHLHGVYI